MTEEELKAALKAAQDENQALKQRYSGIDDPEFARTACEANRKKEIKGLLDEGGLPAVEARVKAEAEKPWIAKVKKLESALNEATMTLDGFKTRDAISRGTEALRAVLSERVSTGKVDAALEMAKGLIAFEGEGEGVKYSVDGSSIGDWVESLLQRHTWLHGETTPQGVPGSSSENSIDINPFLDEHFSIKAQSDLYKTDPEKARRLHEAAKGVRK